MSATHSETMQRIKVTDWKIDVNKQSYATLLLGKKRNLFYLFQHIYS